MNAAAAGHDASKKQGAYGKIPVHKHGKFEQIAHFDEVIAMLLYKLGPSSGTNYMRRGDEHARFCDDSLGKVSRSFAGVIRQLPEELQLDICVFYLALRGLDTVGRKSRQS